MPELLAKQWLEAGQMDLADLDADLLGPQAALDSADWDFGDGSWSQWGLVPILDDRQSNYVCVAIKAPLHPRLVYFAKGLSGRLLFRDIGSLYALVQSRLKAGEDLRLETTPGDFADPSQNDAKDRSDARALINQRAGLSYAVQLLHPDDLDAWEVLLETDETRQDTKARLALSPTPGVGDLLRRDALAFESFLESFRQIAARANLSIGEQRGESLQVGSKWFRLDFLFCARKRPQFDERVVWWLQDQLSGRNPHDRPGNLMTEAD